MLPKFLRKIIGTDGVTQLTQFLKGLEEIDFSHVESSTDFYRLVDPLQKNINYLFDDNEQEQAVSNMLDTFNRLFEEFSGDHIVSMGEYRVIEYIYELIEKFSEKFTRFVSIDIKNITKEKMHSIRHMYVSGGAQNTAPSQTLRNENKVENNSYLKITHTLTPPQPLQSAEDNRTPFCPYCGIHTGSIAGSRRTCKDCGMSFTVRTTDDRVRKIVTEEEAANIDIFRELRIYLSSGNIDKQRRLLEKDLGRKLEYYEIGLMIVEIVGDKMHRDSVNKIRQIITFVGLNQKIGEKRAELNKIKSDGYHFVQIERGECSSIKKRISSKIDINKEIKTLHSLPCKEGGPICVCRYIPASKITTPL